MKNRGLSRRSRYLLKTMLLLSALGLALTQTDRLQSAFARYQRQKTMPQFVDRSARLCHLLQPYAGRLRYLPEMQELVERKQGHGAMRYLWVVTCIDGSGQEIAYFTWNVDTREVIRYSDTRMEYTGARPHALNQRQAFGLFQDWLRTLGQLPENPSALEIIRIGRKNSYWWIEWAIAEKRWRMILYERTRAPIYIQRIGQ